MKQGLKIISGKDLSQDMIDLLNNLWIQIYDEDYKKLDKKKEFENDTIFLIYDQDRVVSLGRLRPVSFEVKKRLWHIQGIADVASMEKRKGWGKKLMTHIKDWLKDHNEIGIGFCEPVTSAFYEKCGFRIYPGLTSRFWYVDKWSGRLENYESDVLYYGSDDLIEDILAHPDEKIMIPYPW